MLISPVKYLNEHNIRYAEIREPNKKNQFNNFLIDLTTRERGKNLINSEK